MQTTSKDEQQNLQIEAIPKVTYLFAIFSTDCFMNSTIFKRMAFFVQTKTNRKKL